MAASDLPPLGPRIREERARRGVSLRALAREVGVSASMISQIETGKSQPSVSTLYAITSALGIAIEDVFQPSETAAGGDGAKRAPASGEAEPAPVPHAPQAAPRAAAPDGPLREDPPGEDPPGEAPLLPGGPLVRPKQRQVLRLDSGVTWERLGQLPGHHVDFLRVTYAPRATSSSNGELMRHSGSEYGFLLRGELVLTLAFEEYRVRAGDAISFDSTTPHGYRNEGTEPAVGVWFVVE